MISNRIVAALTLAAALPLSVAMAGVEPPAMVSSYYNMRLRDAPAGAYEWAEQGLLFVQVRVPEAQGDEAEEMGGRILLAEHEELTRWLAKYATVRKEDPQFSPGMDRLRRLVRDEDPMWEYDAELSYSFNGPHFSRHEIGERVCCAVCKVADVVASMPDSFMQSPGPEAWARGAKLLVAEKFVNRLDRPFLWNAGLVDVLALSLDAGKDLAAWAADFGTGENAAYAEYCEAEKSLRQYLLESETGKWMESERQRLETLPDEISFVWEPDARERLVSSDTIVTTNQLDDLTFDVVTTTVRTTSKSQTLRKVVKRMATDARFEKLFLSAGAMQNASAARTPKGKAAEKGFYSSSSRTAKDREHAIVEALRENPGDKVLWNLLGRVMMSRGDYLGGLVCFRNSLRLDSRYEFALVNLAIAYDKLGYKNLAFGAAIVSQGLASDDWCKREARKILEAK